MASQAPNLLKPGDALGPYRVDALIGKGGMGEVYRGTDTRLGRFVAIKVSAREFSDRFEREAKAISSLNHPNVCTLYDVGPNYLVMEFVEGNTLAHLVKQGPMPLDAVLRYGIQIADALSAAHAKGVIHRDLKPANIIPTSSGVKVLDFGLAKLGATKLGTSEAGGSSSEVVTRTEPMTEPGSILGTLHYMAPEQAEGKETDERSDIFSFGAVLYEMLTGKRAFDGDSKTAILAAILKDQPQPISQFQPQVPRALDRVVWKCLEKKPPERWHSAHDLKQTLELIDLAGPTSASTSVSNSASQAGGLRHKSNKWLWAAVGAVAIAAAVGLALWAPWRKVAPAQAVRFEVGPAAKMTFIDQASMAVSPDGRWMVFPAVAEDGVQRYFIRAIDGIEVRALPGAEGNQTPASWSYDSRWVVFLSGNKLKKVDMQGGPPQALADFPNNRLGGAAWSPDGVIIAGTDGSPILRMPASGRQPTPITALNPGDTGDRWPQFLPDGKHFLYHHSSSDPGKEGVYVGSIDVQPNQQNRQRLLATDRQAYYAPAPGGSTEHLIFLRGTTLMAQPFDPGKMTLSGEPTAIADGVDSFTDTNHGLFSVSDTGTLVYRGGSGPQTRLTWFDLQGNPTGTLGDPGDYAFPAISPDGGRVAVSIGAQTNRDIWILDMARGGASTRFTFEPGRDDTPAWSPDGKNIAFASNRDGQMNLYLKPADSSGEEKLILKTAEYKIAQRFTKDGRFLLFDSTGPKTQQDIWALPFPLPSQGEAKPISLLKTQFIEYRERVSPDGRWLAYMSDESGTNEIYVRPFTPEALAGTSAKSRVSTGGGDRSLWSPDSKELFYLGQTQVMAVDIDTSKGFQAGTPRRMFAAPTGAVTGSWDLSPDGKHFLFVAPPGAGTVIPFTVVLNWAAGLKK
jgi:Tol biopolymer transport system component/predicted Ser/Thr protein kinase